MTERFYFRDRVHFLDARWRLRSVGAKIGSSSSTRRVGTRRRLGLWPGQLHELKPWTYRRDLFVFLASWSRVRVFDRRAHQLERGLKNKGFVIDGRR
jgi:hypothetical protein